MEKAKGIRKKSIVKRRKTTKKVSVKRRAPSFDAAVILSPSTIPDSFEALIPVKKARRVRRKRTYEVTSKFFPARRALFFRIATNRIVQYSFLSLILFTATGGWVLYDQVLKNLPHPSRLKTAPIAQTSIIRDRNGTVLYKVYADANRINLEWNEIPQSIKDATVAIEDADFFTHFGVSAKSILRALLHNLQNDDGKIQGGSTITQQLMKNRFFGSERTYMRKIKEAAMAVWAERLFSKEEILTAYLNTVGFGGPAYGIEAAAQMYFGIPAKDVSLAQAAFLAGLPEAPTALSPFGTNRNTAIARKNYVLKRMRELDMIDEIAYGEATEEPLQFRNLRTDILAPHFVMYVKQELVKSLGEDVVTEGGLDITTTLDLTMQRQAEEIVQKHIAEIKDVYNIHNAAVLVTNPANGEILAMVGSVDYFDVENKGYVNAATSPRQPGSAIKPLNYAYAFDHAGYTPNSVVDDSPVKYVAEGAPPYIPENYDRKFHGRVTIRSALANSYNIPAVKVLNSYGYQNMLGLGRTLGIKSWLTDRPIGLSLTLGGLEVTMLELAQAYGTIANQGRLAEVKSIVEIRDADNKDITYQFYQKGEDDGLIDSVSAAEGDQVISPLASYWLTDILADEKARLPAFGRYAKLSIPNHKVAVKTGTSNSFRDNWTIGYTPDILVSTWVGNNDGSFMNKKLVSGVTGAAPIWNDVMKMALVDREPKEFAIPEGLIPVKICATNGLLTCPYCPQEKTEYFTADKVPTKKCSFKSPTECDAAKTQLEGKSEEEKKQMLVGCPL